MMSPLLRSQGDKKFLKKSFLCYAKNIDLFLTFTYIGIFDRLFRGGETVNPPGAVAPPDEGGDPIDDAVQSAIRSAELRQKARDAAAQAAKEIDSLVEKIKKK